MHTRKKLSNKIQDKLIKDTQRRLHIGQGQDHTQVHVHNMSSHGDLRTYAKIWYCLCQKAKTSYQTQIHSENIILIFRSKVKVIQSS